MPGLVPGIHELPQVQAPKAWMAGTSPAMTNTFSITSNGHPRTKNGC